MNPHSFDAVTLYERSSVGIMAKPEFLRELQREAEPHARLLLPMRFEEIAERDGQCGKPFWIVIGKDVFDITGKFALTIEGSPSSFAYTPNFRFSVRE